jgi:PAS domain S-box-containing protein
MRVRRPDGEIRNVMFKAECHLDGQGAVTTLYGVVQDITDEKRAAASLVTSEAKYRAIAEYTSDLIVRADMQGTLLYVSPACRTLGYEPEDLIGRPGAELVHPDDVAVFYGTVAKLIAGEPIDRGLDREIRYRRKNGEWVWLEGSPQVIRDAAGQPIELLNVYRDVSERRRAQLAVRQADAARNANVELFETAFSHAPIGESLVSVEGGFLKVNPAFCGIVGYSEEQLLDLDFQTITHAEDIDKDLELLHQLIAGQIPSYQMDKRYIRADGTIVWVNLSVSMIADVDGLPKYFVSQVQDLTARRAAEAAHVESEHRFRRLADNAPDIIAESTLDGLLTYVSPACLAITGYSPDLLVGRAYVSLMHPEDGPKVEAMCQAVLAAKGALAPWTVEFRAEHVSGRELWLECKPTPIVDTVTGEFIGINDVIRDITARKAMEAELRQSRAEAESSAAVKGEFLANMSHELRTPLTSIVGFTRLAAEQPDLGELTRTYVDRVAEASRALLCTVNDILDFSKLEVGQVSFQPEPTSLSKLSRATLELFMPQAGAKDLDLWLDGEDTGEAGDLVISVDPDRIRQILLNLVGNAVKFTDKGGVTLRTRYNRAAGALSVEVIDTGGGIPPDKQDALFKRFSQVDGSLTRSHGGTGLGLAICKGLVEAMGGEIGVDSRAGEGSRFWFTIPAPLADLPQARAEGASAALPTFAGVRVLVVDDHPANRELARLILAGVGAEVSDAADGEAAAELAAVWPYDVILMDLRMPRLDGEGAMRRIRETPGPNDATPILAFTADADARTNERLEAIGFQGVVAKPLEPSALIDAVARATAFADNQQSREQTHVA